MSDQHLTKKLFTDLDLPESLLKGIQDAGFRYCTPIQAETLPLALSGRDVAGQAQTGTGKTAAFLLATFTHLIKHPCDARRRPNQPRAVILAPTRELAVQIHRDAIALGKHADFKLVLVFGGTGYDSQRRQLEEGVDVLIGTPGRIIDYFKQHVFDLKAVQVMVLDEADRMFDLGFIKDIRYLLKRMTPPTERLGMLFSATLSYRVIELAYEHMNNPGLVRIEPDKVTVDRVKQVIYHPANAEKIPLLIALLKHMDPTRSLVFTNTKGAAERVQAWLQGNGFQAEALTGDVPQVQRLRLMQDFQEGRLPILVATDVAARGLHIPDVSHVFNFDLPQDAEDYVHRIGRTARVGKSGDAISFACEEYAYSLMDIEKYIGHKIPTGRIEDEMLEQPQPPARRRESAHRGRERTRPSSRGGARPRGGARRETATRSKSPGAPKETREHKHKAAASAPDTRRRKVEPPAKLGRRRGGSTPVVG